MPLKVTVTRFHKAQARIIIHNSTAEMTADDGHNNLQAIGGNIAIMKNPTHIKYTRS